MPSSAHDAVDAQPRWWPGTASTPRATPTDPEDYALLNGVFAGGAAALMLTATRRAAAGQEPIGRGEVPLLALATFALAQVIAKEKVATWLREPFVEETADGENKPKGTRLRFAVGELLTCTRCVGAWSALGLVGLRVLRPREARVVTAMLGASAVNDFLQAGFSWTTAKCDRAQQGAEAPSSEPRFVHAS